MRTLAAASAIPVVSMARQVNSRSIFVAIVGSPYSAPSSATSLAPVPRRKRGAARVSPTRSPTVSAAVWLEDHSQRQHRGPWQGLNPVTTSRAAPFLTAFTCRSSTRSRRRARHGGNGIWRAESDQPGARGRQTPDSGVRPAAWPVLARNELDNPSLTFEPLSVNVKRERLAPTGVEAGRQGPVSGRT
jgi:hypothetical protein